jgi:hypothetical protein
MQSGIPHSHIPVELPPEYRAEFMSLQNRLLHWRLDHFFKPLREPERLPIESRLQQLYLPLASVTEDEAALAPLRDAMLALQADMTEARRDSVEGSVLVALLALTQADDPKSSHRVQVKQIAAKASETSRYPMHSKKAKAICLGFGLRDGGKTNEGATVLFDRDACAAVLRQYGLAEPVDQPSEPLAETSKVTEVMIVTEQVEAPSAVESLAEAA